MHNGPNNQSVGLERTDKMLSLPLFTSSFSSINEGTQSIPVLRLAIGGVTVCVDCVTEEDVRCRNPTSPTVAVATVPPASTGFSGVGTTNVVVETKGDA